MPRSYRPHDGQSPAARWAAERNNPDPLPPETDADIRDWHDGIRVYLFGGPFHGLADSKPVSVPRQPRRGYAPAELKYEVRDPALIRDGNPRFWVTQEQYFAVYLWDGQNDEWHSYSYVRSELADGSIYGVACILWDGTRDQMNWIDGREAPALLTGLEGMGPTTVYERVDFESYQNPYRIPTAYDRVRNRSWFYPIYVAKYRRRFVGGGKEYHGEKELVSCLLPFKAPRLLTFVSDPGGGSYLIVAKFRFDSVKKDTNVYRYVGTVRKRRPPPSESDYNFDNLY